MSKRSEAKDDSLPHSPPLSFVSWWCAWNVQSDDSGQRREAERPPPEEAQGCRDLAPSECTGIVLRWTGSSRSGLITDVPSVTSSTLFDLIDSFPSHPFGSHNSAPYLFVLLSNFTLAPLSLLSPFSFSLSLSPPSLCLLPLTSYFLLSSLLSPPLSLSQYASLFPPYSPAPSISADGRNSTSY